MTQVFKTTHELAELLRAGLPFRIEVHGERDEFTLAPVPDEPLLSECFGCGMDVPRREDEPPMHLCGDCADRGVEFPQ